LYYPPEIVPQTNKMERKKINDIISFWLIFILFISCDAQILPPEKFVFDSKFDSLYKAISYKDTILFENSKNRIDTFVLTKADSVISNRINCFMCPRAGKSFFRNYKQYPDNYWADDEFENQGTNQEKRITREVALITITKIPDADLNTAYLSFKNFHCSIEGSLGKLLTDTLILNNNYFTSYYILYSTAESLIVDDDDVELVFITLRDGIIAYKEKSGILRRRIFF
jgi:hypothetical protein